MKIVIYLALIFPVIVSAQHPPMRNGRTDTIAGLALDPMTRLIQIKDSVQVGKGFTVFKMEELILNWCDYTAFDNHWMKVMSADSRKMKFDGGFGTIAFDSNGDRYRRGQLGYASLAPNGRKDKTDKLNGGVTYRLIFAIHGEWLVLSFSDLYFFSSNNVLGHFEEPGPTASDGVHILTEQEFPWRRVRRWYYSCLQKASQDLKRFLLVYRQNPLQTVNPSKHPW